MPKKREQPKEKRVNKTKQQLIDEANLKKEVDRKRTRVREELYPLLKGKDLSVHEIHQICYLMGQFIRQGFIQLQKTMKLSELKMEDVLKGDDMKNFLELYELFKDESVMSAVEFVDGMAKQISDTMVAGQKDIKFETIDLKLY